MGQMRTKTRKTNRMLLAWVRSHPCLMCGGYKDNTLHHLEEPIRDTNGKRLSFYYLASSRTKKKLIEEFAKCVTLCKACHEQVHRSDKEATFEQQFDTESLEQQWQMIFDQLPDQIPEELTEVEALQVIEGLTRRDFLLGTWI